MLRVESLDQNLLQNTSLFDNYKKNLLHNGKLVIQYYDDDKLIAIMNDYDDETGEFRDSEYVKTTREFFENGYFYTCTCRIYHTLLECLDNNEGDPKDTVDENGIKCMHCRFLHNDVVPNLDQNNSATNLQNVVQAAMSLNETIIVELPSGRREQRNFQF